MISLNTPLQIQDGALSKTEDLKAAINHSLEVLLNTPLNSVPIAPDYGFALIGLKFENIDESQGTFYVKVDSDVDPIYKLKISGSSKNLQTFASELNETIRLYEPRLTDTSTVMTYVRLSRSIVIAIRGTMVGTNEPYEYRTLIKLWN